MRYKNPIVRYNRFWFLTLVVMASSCRFDAKEDISKKFSPILNSRKNVSVKFYNSGGYIASPFLDNYSNFRRLYLNDDNSFILHNLEFAEFAGEWKLKGDTAVLYGYTKRRNDLSFVTTFSKTHKNNKSILIVSDKTNFPIQNFLIQPFNNKPGYYYGTDGQLIFNPNNHDMIDKFPNNFNTDSTGMVKINKLASDSIDFTKLNMLTGKHFSISTKDLPDTIRLKINLNAVAFSFAKVYCIYFNDLFHPPPMRVIINKSRFIEPLD